MSIKVGRPRYVRSVNSVVEIGTEKKSSSRDRCVRQRVLHVANENTSKKSGNDALALFFRSIIPLQLFFLAELLEFEKRAFKDRCIVRIEFFFLNGNEGEFEGERVEWKSKIGQS